MSAYLIADVKVSNPEQYVGYQALTPTAIAAGGGEFVVRGGQTEVIEGDWIPNRVVVIRFPDMDTARKFYDSELYLAARAARAGATDIFNMILVQGV
ncbi:MAG: DUF1330 domain-containing protein [Betaproteobacteria bacterium]|nr:DUF1330 domain-containing protein [Betaproteobacteria bacterium]